MSIPPGRGHLSRIDTNFTLNVYDDPWETNRQTSPSKVFDTASYTLPAVPVITKSSDTGNSADLKRTRIGIQKALSEVLIQLAKRDKPPAIVDTIRNTSRDSPERSIGALAETLKQAVKRRGRQKTKNDRTSLGTTEDDSDEETDTLFSTDATIELVLQWTNLLNMAMEQGCFFFDEKSTERETALEDDSKHSYSFRKSRNSFTNGSKWSRSGSPSKRQNQVPELLSSCLSILKSVVSEDCRYRVGSPRPSRPSNSLQILTLNVAQILAYTHRHDPHVLSEIAFAMIPAFYSFPRQMNPRLLHFFETSVVRVVLQNLAGLQGIVSQDPTLVSTHVAFSPNSEDNEIPIVSIQIDEVLSQRSPHMPGKWDSARSMGGEIQSTNNPRQSSHIYYLAFLIPPLFGAILDSVESGDEADLSTGIYAQAAQLIRTISVSKVDTYNDLLEVIAHSGPKSRRWAIASLCELWPKSVGHAIISSPFHPTRRLSDPNHNNHDPYSHQFVPWYFDIHQNWPRADNVLHCDCRSCLKPIHGFALMCPSCMTAVHFDCYDYPRGNYHIQYTAATETSVQRFAILRFSDILKSGATEVLVGHTFKPGNWFTLCLCFVCQKPLWGCFAQGLKCERCPAVLHLGCLALLSQPQQCGAIEITSKHVVIDFNLLRQSCLDHFPILSSTAEELNSGSYEEISIYQSALQIQLQILNNGITFGSIIVDDKGKASNSITGTIDDFELHRILDQCKQLLDIGRLPFSPLTQQYIQDGDQHRPVIMFNWSYLEYITAAIKASSPQSHYGSAATSDFLNVEQPFEVDTSEIQDAASLPYESVTLGQIRSILRTDFTLRSDIAATFILDQLYQLSFLDRVDNNPYPFENLVLESDLKCIFPLPLGLDLSMNVETLVSSIEASLSDLDLTSNEFGFLLLTRRFWPNGLASEYGLKRLALRVFSWILDEDNSLAIILREYVAKQKNLPGVRTHEYAEPWPSSLTTRLAPSGVANNGGDFVSARRLLLSRFALPWLLELHDLDPSFYCQIMFGACCDIVDDEGADFESSNPLNGQSKKKDSYTRCDDILRSIIRLSHCSVMFTVFDDLFLRWMDFVFSSGAGERAFPSLHRLSTNEAGQSASQSPTISTTNPISSSPDAFRTPSIDPLRAISNFANQSDTGLSLSISYLPMLIKSGVNIPIQTFKHFLPLLMANKGGSLKNANTFIEALALSLWIKPSRGQDFQDAIATLHSHLSSQISWCLVSGQNPDICLSIIRQSLCACLRVYGCDRASIIDAGLMSDSEIHNLPSQRKLTGREGRTDDPIFIHPKILDALALYIQSKVDDVTCYAAKFLDIFLTGCPFLESFEIDNFVLQNGKIIASCAWATYNIQREDIATARTRLLLRSLLIDSEPLQEILSTNMDPTRTSIKERLSSINRLFRIVLDVTSPDFQVEDRQWRSSVTEVFNCYFSPLWNDSSEEIRTSIRSSSAALLPAHFEIISQCWSESLLKAPIIERTRLIGFLLQLRAHFTTWKVLSWDAMIETLVEYDYDLKNNDRMSSHDHINSGILANNNLLTADPEMAHLRVSIILLGLQMLADGIDVDFFSLMKLKVQFVQITGFNEVSVVPTQNGQNFRLQFSDIAEIEEAAYPCIEELVHVIDAPYYLKVPQSALGIADSYYEDEQANVLVGSVFLDAILTMLGTMQKPASLPVLTFKSLLEALYIIIHKYDIGIAPLVHLQTSLLKAILRTVGLISQDLSYELRQLSLSIAQEFNPPLNATLPAKSGNERLFSIILEAVATEVASQTRHSQDALIVQAKSLIGNTLQMFYDKGLLMCLLRRPLQPSMFTVLHQVLNDEGKDAFSGSTSICEYLLRDTLLRSMDCDSRYFSTMLENISSFVEVVYFQGYSSELLAYCAHRLGNLASRMLDGSIAGMDSSPLITILSILIKNNKKNIKALLPHVDTILRVALHRLVSNETCLTRLIKASLSVQSRVNETSGSADVVNVLFEILLDGFGMRTKMSPITMKALIRSLLAADKAMLLPLAIVQRQPFRTMIDDAYSFLQNYNSSEDNVNQNVHCVMETAKLLLGAINRDPAHFQRLTEPATDKSSRTPPTMRSWNMLLLVTLQESEDDWKTMIYDQFTSFCNTYSAVLRTYVSSGIASAATATTDINQAHISLKLWVMLAHSISMSAHNGETSVAGVWNELWPAYEGFLDVLDTEARVGAYPALVSLASASVADLIVYMRSLKTSLSLDTSAYVAILDRLRTLRLGDSSSHKITRTLHLMSEPPVQVPDTALLNQIAKELVAAEKIRIMEGA